jgi:hypothetical protein
LQPKTDPKGGSDRIPPVGSTAKGEKEKVMTIDQEDRTVVTQTPPAVAGQETVPAAARQETVRTDSRRTTRSGPGGSEMIRRIIVLVFGLIQIVIGVRIVLLLLDARTGNALVSGILDVSQVFVGPFEGILKTNALSSGGSTLDVAAVVAFVGWTILELIVVWAVGIFRREPV